VSSIGGATVTTNEPVAVLPALSLAEQLTFVCPGAFRSAGVSPAVDGRPARRHGGRARRPTAADEDVRAPIYRSWITRPRYSVSSIGGATVTTNEPVAVLPALSLAAQLTFVCPGAKSEPDAG